MMHHFLVIISDFVFKNEKLSALDKTKWNKYLKTMKSFPIL